MSQALSDIGGFLGSGAGKGLLTGGVAGGGLIQNWLAERQANAKQKFVQDLITHPEKFNALVARTEQPLSKGLTTDIARQTDAYGAERGLGSSPYIMRDVYAQALAPAELQQQQMAINSLLSRLGIYAQQPTMPGVNVTPMLQALSMWKPGAGTTSDTGGWNMAPGGGGGTVPWGGPGGTAPFPMPSVDVNTGDFGGLTWPGIGTQQQG